MIGNWESKFIPLNWIILIFLTEMLKERRLLQEIFNPEKVFYPS